MSSHITDILANNVAPQVTAQLQPELRKFFIGAIVRQYLPQTWLFISETGMGTLAVDNNGLAKAYDGQAGNPDVSITWTDEAFHASLVLQDRSAVPASAGQPTVQKFTTKGATAFDFLRKRFNL